MSYSYKQLREMEINNLIEEHDKLAKHTSVGVRYFLDEIARRDSERARLEAEKVNKSMLKCTKWITGMTVAMLILTTLNVVVAVVSCTHF